MRSDLLRGVRPVDIVVTVLLGGLAAWLALEVILTRETDVRLDSHSWLMLPVSLAAALPVLWWRRHLVAVLVVSCTAMALHLLAFGAVVRCGSGLPLVFVLSFLSGLDDRPRVRRTALALSAVLNVLVLVRDTAAGVGLLPVTLGVAAVLFGIGRLTAHRSAMTTELRARNEDLRRMRDERSALEVTGERRQLSTRLESLLDRRLGQLAATADTGARSADPVHQRALLAELEEDGRRTLDDMREIVGLLRGGEVALAPVPSVAHLDALLAQHLQARPRLQVSGDPRLLPASVELSAYRIVEHLVTVFADDPTTPVDVSLGFSDTALEIRVAGQVTRGADMRGAVGRARERTLLHAGSLEVRSTRGRTRVVALLPVTSGA